jgi:hypothetical protein
LEQGLGLSGIVLQNEAKSGSTVFSELSSPFMQGVGFCNKNSNN